MVFYSFFNVFFFPCKLRYMYFGFGYRWKIDTINNDVNFLYKLNEVTFLCGIFRSSNQRSFIWAYRLETSDNFMHLKCYNSRILSNRRRDMGFCCMYDLVRQILLSFILFNDEKKTFPLFLSESESFFALLTYCIRTVGQKKGIYDTFSLKCKKCPKLIIARER